MSEGEAPREYAASTESKTRRREREFATIRELGYGAYGDGRSDCGSPRGSNLTASASGSQRSWKESIITLSLKKVCELNGNRKLGRQVTCEPSQRVGTLLT